MVYCARSSKYPVNAVDRTDGRRADELRPTKITPNYLRHAEGSALIEVGDTKVLCAVSYEDRVPPFLRNTGRGWVTAEYGMLPRSTNTRMEREASRGRVSGRTQEIQRLIGRSLRAVVDLNELGERSFTVDCDVIQADGGTRTAAITGAYVALALAIKRLRDERFLKSDPLRGAVAATSAGVVLSRPLLDLKYDEDSVAEVDFNVVMTDAGEFVEVQGTAEGRTFSREVMDRILALAEAGIQQLFAVQRDVLAEAGALTPERPQLRHR
jgi:ribonuclease PH